MISAPSEMRCMSMPMISMQAKTTASVSGIESATTRPGLTPRLMKLTTRMIAIDCQSEVMKSWMASSTVTAWSATRFGSIPCGRSAVIFAIAVLMLAPSARMSPPSRMAMPRPIASRPLTRNMGCGGSAWPRRTVAISARRTMRSPTGKFTWSRSASDWKAPETRSEIRSSGVWIMPEGRTMFWACSAAKSAPRSIPRLASSRTENSTKMRSSCAPMISILETSGTKSRRERAASTWSRSSRPVKPSAVKP